MEFKECSVHRYLCFIDCAKAFQCVRYVQLLAGHIAYGILLAPWFDQLYVFKYL